MVQMGGRRYEAWGELMGQGVRHLGLQGPMGSARVDMGVNASRSQSSRRQKAFTSGLGLDGGDETREGLGRWMKGEGGLASGRDEK